MCCVEQLLFRHGDDNPAGSGSGELASGEAPDDDLLSFDPGGILGGLAVEVRADDSGYASLHADAVDRHGKHMR